MSYGLQIKDAAGNVVLDSRDHVWNVAGVFTYPGGGADITHNLAPELRYLPGEVMVVSSGDKAGRTLQYTLRMSDDPPTVRLFAGDRPSTVYVMVK